MFFFIYYVFIRFNYEFVCLFENRRRIQNHIREIQSFFIDLLNWNFHQFLLFIQLLNCRFELIFVQIRLKSVAFFSNNNPADVILSLQIFISFPNYDMTNNLQISNDDVLLQSIVRTELILEIFLFKIHEVLHSLYKWIIPVVFLLSEIKFLHSDFNQYNHVQKHVYYYRK